MIKITNIAYHRNGIIGTSFYAVLFHYKALGKQRNMLGIVFEEPHHCAFVCTDLLNDREQGVDFGHNSFRCEFFEKEIRQAIKEYESKRYESKR